MRRFPTPSPGEGQVLVKLAASGLNYIDVYQRTGSYPNALPYTLGLEGSGTVAGVGAGVASRSRKAIRSPGPACPAPTPSMPWCLSSAWCACPTGWTSKWVRQRCCRE